jgi:hypothetical protein
MLARREGKACAMKKLGLVHAWWSCCAGVCLLVVACSSEVVGDGEGRGGAEAGRGSVTGGRTSGGASGGGVGGTAGAGARPGGGTSGGGQGGACTEDVTNGVIPLIQRTLAEYCGDNDCPETLEQARAGVLACREGQYSEERTGCGYTVVSFDGQEWGHGYVFDDGVLVGAYSFDDVIEPPCDTQGEVGGIYPPACPGAESCRHCDQEDGSGGAGPFCKAGLGGAGGASE